MLIAVEKGISMNNSIKGIKIMNPVKTVNFLREIDLMLNRSLEKLFKTRTMGEIINSNQTNSFYNSDDDTRIDIVLINYKVKILVYEKIISKEYATKLLEIYNKFILLNSAGLCNQEYFEFMEILNEFGLLENDFSFSEMFKDSYIKMLEKKKTIDK